MTEQNSKPSEVRFIRRDDISGRIWIGILSLVLSAAGLVYFEVQPWDANLALTAPGPALALALFWCIVVNAVRRRPMFGRLRASLWTWAILSVSTFFVTAEVVLLQYHAVQPIEQFVKSDFDQFDKANSGVVFLQDLDVFVRKQTTLEQNVSLLQSAEAVVKGSAGSDPEKQSALEALAVLRRADVKDLLPAEQRWRIAVTNRNACAVGTRSDSEPHQCSVTKEQLLGYRAQLDARYPIWLKLFKLTRVSF